MSNGQQNSGRIPAGTGSLVDESSALNTWQRRLLPLLVRIVVGLTIFFFVITLGQLGWMNWHLQREPPDVLASLEQLSSEGRIASLDANTILESEIIKRRYRMASTLMMAQLWIRYMGFVTGMIMAIIGSAFVLGKLREPSTNFEAEGGGTRVSLVTASPGLLLVLFGSALMLATIVTKQETSVRDVAVYTPRQAPAGAPTTDVADSIRDQIPIQNE